MNWKEFLKPTWQKVLVFILLFQILFFIQSLFFIPEIKNQTAFSIIGMIIHPFDIFTLFLPTGQFITTLAYILPFNFIFLIIGILNSFYQYLFSCLIVWIYDRIREKRK
jgi:hypothetical protein